MLLAIDTSAGTGVALVADGVVRAEHAETDTRRHAEVVGDLIRAALDDAGCRAADVTGVVVGMGPGPFTGLRVGIAAARAFAFGAGCPLLPLVSHDAVAFGADAPLTVVTDARRREVYWSGYAGADESGAPVRDRGPALGRIDDVPDDRERIVADRIPAGALGRLAHTLLLAGRPFAADTALYLRSPDVTMSATNLGGRRVS